MEFIVRYSEKVPFLLNIEGKIIFIDKEHYCLEVEEENVYWISILKRKNHEVIFKVYHKQSLLNRIRLIHFLSKECGVIVLYFPFEIIFLSCKQRETVPILNNIEVHKKQFLDSYIYENEMYFFDGKQIYNFNLTTFEWKISKEDYNSTIKEYLKNGFFSENRLYGWDEKFFWTFDFEKRFWFALEYEGKFNDSIEEICSYESGKALLIGKNEYQVLEFYQRKVSKLNLDIPQIKKNNVFTEEGFLFFYTENEILPIIIKIEHKKSIKKNEEKDEEYSLNLKNDENQEAS